LRRHTGNTNIKAHDVDPADFDRVLGINLRGAFMLSKHVLPHMVAQKYGVCCTSPRSPARRAMPA
jgi:NAD(P)-dependent dehydrogenase (short-subunit alcohol dehydrogenase family)